MTALRAVSNSARASGAARGNSTSSLGIGLDDAGRAALALHAGAPRHYRTCSVRAPAVTARAASSRASALSRRATARCHTGERRGNPNSGDSRSRRGARPPVDALIFLSATTIARDTSCRLGFFHWGGKMSPQNIDQWSIFLRANAAKQDFLNPARLRMFGEGLGCSRQSIRPRAAGLASERSRCRRLDCICPRTPLAFSAE
jgi:hypothetical protein